MTTRVEAVDRWIGGVCPFEAGWHKVMMWWFIVTDGLPTQGRTRPQRNFVGVDQRTRLFEEARRTLPKDIPVDVILLPMQGDRPAAHRFWALARQTGGNFLVPGPDWP